MVDCDSDISIVGKQKIQEFRKNRTYQRILVVIDSAIVYSTYLIVWSLLSLLAYVIRHLFLLGNEVTNSGYDGDFIVESVFVAGYFQKTTAPFCDLYCSSDFV